MPSFPASHQQENAILQPSVSKQSQQEHYGNQVPVLCTMKVSLPQPDGLPRTYLSPFHRSSTPSSVPVGKENNIQGQRREARGSQLAAVSSDQHAGLQKDTRIGSLDETRPPMSWSPRRGKREQGAGGSTSVTQVLRSVEDANDINMDFERLLVSRLSSLLLPF